MAGECNGTQVGGADTPVQCCEDMGGSDYANPSGTCFRCSDIGGLYTCMYLSLMLSKQWMMYIGMTHWGGIDRYE